jgi:molybdopterin converting factor small subunit
VGKRATIDVEDGLTVRALIERLAIPPELAQMVLVNGQDVAREQQRVLQDGDTVSIFPPVAGGSVNVVNCGTSIAHSTPPVRIRIRLATHSDCRSASSSDGGADLWL